MIAGLRTLKLLPTVAGIAALAVALGCDGEGSTPTPALTPRPTATPTPSPTPTPSGPAVSVVITDKQGSRLAAGATEHFDIGVGGSNVVYVDEAQLYQTVEGFGASFTDSAAYLLNQVATTTARDTAMGRLFGRGADGIGMSFMRNPMGASDLARFDYSFDDLPTGSTDPTLASFSIAHDQADIIPLIKTAKQFNPDMKVMASPWSPPGWMKTNGDMDGGQLLSTMYTPFTNYFVKYIQAYAAEGLSVDYVSLQNEPLYDTSTNPHPYPGMLMDAGVQTTLVRDYFLPAFTTAGITSKILLYDHNWDGAVYPETVLADETIAASSQVAGIAWHGYGGTAGAMTTLHNQLPAKGNYMSEWSGGTWIADQLRSDFQIITLCMRNYAKGYIKWSLALDQNMGPHNGGCDVCTAPITVNTTTGNITYNIEFYTLGHFSKYVMPGATRVYSSNAAGIVTAAFVNPDASKVLVAFNDTLAANTFQVQWGGKRFSYTLGALSGATFTWSGTQDGTYAVPATSQIQASSYNDVLGLQAETGSDIQFGYDLGFSDDGDWAMYKNVDFGPGMTAVDARVASAGSGGTLEFRLGSPTGTLIGSTTLPVTGGWQTWSTVSGTVSNATGVHDLYVVFKGSGTAGIGNLNWIKFR